MNPSRSSAAQATRVSRVELPNGLVVIFHENHANPTVAIQGLVKAGALFDPPRLGGLSGFVAAMLDRGTSTRTAYEQAEALESLGASLHFDSGPETITFSGNTLSHDLGTVLLVLADALGHPGFAPDQIEKGRDELIVRVKISNENTAYVASRTANEMLYPSGHPYHRPSIGTEDSLRAVRSEDLAEFHAAHYGPNTTVLVLAGDVDPDSTIEEVKRSFLAWERLGKVPEFAVPRASAHERAERRVVQMKGKSQVDVVCALPGISRTDPEYYAVMLSNFVLGGGSLSSRLMDNLRDKQGLVYGVYSTLNAGIGAGPIQIRAGTNPASADRTADEILIQVARMHAEGPDATEIEEAVSYLTGVFPVRMETNSGVASQLLGAELYGLGMDYIERYPGIIRGITLDETREAGRKHLRPAGHALALAGSYPDSGTEGEGR
jgi:zinc protease